MSEKRFSSKELFALEDNEVPPVIRDCFIALISPFEEFFSDGQVPSLSSGDSSDIPDPMRKPTYPASPEFKRDWLEWVYLELKVRLELAVRYYNFRGERLGHGKGEAQTPDRKQMPIILFLRKFRRVETGLHAFKNEAPSVVLREMGALQSASSGEADPDTSLRGQIERRFPSYPVLWIANPRDALSFSGYLTRDQHGHELNKNSVPYVLTPTWSKVQNWRQSVEYLIRASDAIVIANSSKEGGVGEEQELLSSLNALDRTFVTNPENLDSPVSSIGLADDLTEEKLHHLKGADPPYLGKVAGWGHWAGFESLKYAGQYLGALDELWGRNLDSGKEISCDYFSALFTALTALLAFRGELKGAAQIAQGLAATIVTRSKGEKTAFLLAPGEFHRQDILAVEVLEHTSKWYSAHDELHGTVTGLAALSGSIP
jgi:hypothetical protein